MAFVSGAEIDCDDHDQWSALQPLAGSVVECHLPTSSLRYTEDEWAAFFITQVETRLDGSLLLGVHFMGTPDATVADTIETMLRRGAKVHFCLSRPCLDVDPGHHIEALHVTRVRIWERDDFEADYLVKGIAGLMKKWIKELEGGDTGAKKRPAARTPRAKKPPGAGKDAGAPKGKREGAGRSGLTDEMRAELSRKLAAAKKRHKAHREEADDPGEEPEEDGSSIEEVSSSPEDIGLATGSVLDGPREKHKEKVAEARHKVQGALEDIKDSATKSLTGQLAQQAVALAAQRRKEKKKKKHKKKSTQTKLAEALSRILTGSSAGSKTKKKKKKKKKKDKKRKRRVTRDGTIVSCSSSCSSSSVQEEEDKVSSDTDLEAPIKKRSRDNPGSVLALLTSHVRETMDQAALTEVPTGEECVTKGVKIATYFALHVKPQFPTQQRELREMFSLAATLDLLRRGDVARVGDSLAARFMALHQALLDQSWATARHMELHAMEETSAGSAALVLASRKHGRLVEKVQGRGGGSWPGWSGGARGRGKGSWKGSGEAPWGQRGEKGKGKEKGKKGRGKNAAWENKVGDWEKNKEKADEK